MASEHAELLLLEGHALLRLGHAAAALELAVPVLLAASDRPTLLPHLWLAESRAGQAPDHARADELAAAAAATFAGYDAWPPS